MSKGDQKKPMGPGGVFLVALVLLCVLFPVWYQFRDVDMAVEVNGVSLVFLVSAAAVIASYRFMILRRDGRKEKKKKPEKEKQTAKSGPEKAPSPLEEAEQLTVPVLDVDSTRFQPPTRAQRLERLAQAERRGGVADETHPAGE